MANLFQLNLEGGMLLLFVTPQIQIVARGDVPFPHPINTGSCQKYETHESSKPNPTFVQGTVMSHCFFSNRLTNLL
jgi:hypothetical protein